MKRRKHVSPGIDVLGLGAVAVDDLFFLNEFPQPDSKVRVVSSERQAGGLTGTALVAAVRLGCSAAYAGTLGEDELSRFITDGLESEGISTKWVVRRAGTRPYRSAIIVDMKTKSRSIELGIAKINIASELVHGFRRSLTSQWAEQRNLWTPLACGEAKQLLEPVIERWIRMTGAAGKA